MHVARQVSLVDNMRNIPFEFMGERSTYWNLYFGRGLLLGVLLLTLAITLWLRARWSTLMHVSWGYFRTFPLLKSDRGQSGAVNA